MGDRSHFKHEDEGASPKMAKRLEAVLHVPAASSAAPRATTAATPPSPAENSVSILPAVRDDD